MSGIGCIIIALQTSLLLGHEPRESGTIGALMEIPRAVADPNIAALILGVLTLLIAFKWPARLAKIVPPPLAALIIGTLVVFSYLALRLWVTFPQVYPASSCQALIRKHF